MSKEHEDLDAKQEESKVKQESEPETSKMDRFDRLMFGPRPRRDENRTLEKNTKANKTDEVDFNQLMGQLDDIMTSIGKIKPAFKDLSPFLNFFKKK
ncbi:hypothetical protein E1I69_15715 [Bacillus timonensis]|uniref:Uncharacterized protein n=1 Tax=Bacillus timonensis TaxID=1033734 RepID=A0A4S3PQZ3_9BACI|nr:hypothetical protein [Bacillus timonensis]THE11192.1 hypothetical protein E1I69_15715 [Bacillus timonensis]